MLISLVKFFDAIMGAEESRESVPRNNNTMPNLVPFIDSIMGAEESRQSAPRNNTTRNRQSSGRPSVTEFSKNPAGYPGFILVLVLSTGKMEVMTRQETRAKAAQIKIISDNSDSVNSSFFQFSSNSDDDYDDDDFLYHFDPATGELKVRQNRAVQNPYQRSENLCETWDESRPEAELCFDPSTGKLMVCRVREVQHRF